MQPAFARAGPIRAVVTRAWNPSGNNNNARFSRLASGSGKLEKLVTEVVAMRRIGQKAERRWMSSDGGKNVDDGTTAPRKIPRRVVRTCLTSPSPDPTKLTSWGKQGPLILTREALLNSNRPMMAGKINERMKEGGEGGSGSGGDGSGKGGDLTPTDETKTNFLKTVSTDTLQNLMRSLFYIPLTEGTCAIGFFTRVSMRDLSQQWTDELQDALNDIAGAGRNLEDTWACGFVTSCNVFRKGVNVSDQLPLVSALTGKTFMFDFDNVLNYNFSDPFTDVAFVQLTPMQIWNAQLFDFVFLPMKLDLEEDIYDRTKKQSQDVIIAKQTQGDMSMVLRQSHEGVDGNVKAVESYLEKLKQGGNTLPFKTLDENAVFGAAPAVNMEGDLVGISKRKLQDTELLLPTRMLSGAIAVDLHNQVDLAKEPNFVFRPEWMDFKIRYTDLHNLGLLKHPLAHNNEEMLDFVDWPFYEVWYERTAPVNNLSFVLTQKYWYMRPEEEYRGMEGGKEGGKEAGREA